MLGLVDLESTKVQKGTQVVPLKHKILSGYNDEVAIRRLVDVTDEQREKIHQTIMKVMELPIVYTIYYESTTMHTAIRIHDSMIAMIVHYT